MAVANFDQLNNLVLVPLEDIPEESRRSEPYEEYFDEDFTEQEREDRIETARKLEEPVRDYLTLLMIMLWLDMDRMDDARDEFVQSLSEENIGDEDYRVGLADDLYDSTMRNQDDPWFFSEDRVYWVSENESQTVENAKDFALAKARGMTRKQWIGMADKRERKTHLALNDKILPIDALYDIGKAKGLYPKDTMSPMSTLAEHPEEIINCRCRIEYLR